METGDSSAARDDLARLTPGVQAHVDQFFRVQGAWAGPVGTFAGGAIFVALQWPYMGRVRLLVWLGTLFVVAMFMFCANQFERLRRPVDSRGVPWTTNLAAALAGLAYGASMWIDLQAMREPTSMLIGLTVLFAISSGSIGGLAGLTGTGRYVLRCLWPLAAIALLMLGQWLIAAGVALYLAIIGRDTEITRDMLFEVLVLREESRLHALDAERASQRDPLTRLLNRAGLEAATERLRSADSAATAMFVDLDHFKAVNDRFGHAAGDKVIVEASRRLLQSLRPGDVVARLGGDEFLIVIEGELSDERRAKIAAGIIANLEIPFVVGNFEARISASIGITVVSEGAFDLGAVQREADHALYVAKGQGRRRWVRFNEAVRDELDAQTGLETALRHAVANGAIDAWGQPIVDLQNGDIIAVELLARWQRDDGAYCPPDVFIPLAEEIGVIDDLGRQILEKAGATLGEWANDPALSSVAVSVNISPRQLVDDGFVSAIDDLMERFGIRPSLLILELTETAELHGVADIDTKLQQLVELGVRLALDDFGTGYSSVQSLMGFPLEYVKLDGSLIRSLGQDPRQIALVRSIRDLANTLGNAVVVECVETQRQAEQLAELKLRYVQGFLYGRARPLSELDLTTLNFVPTPVLL